MKQHLIIDIESLGFSEKKSSIVEIGWLVTEPDFTPVIGDSIYILPQEGVDADETMVKTAADVNGYDPVLWAERGAVSIADARTELAQVMSGFGGPYLAWACNAPFDRRWVEHHFPLMRATVGAWKCSMPLFREYCKLTSTPIVATVKDEFGKVVTPGTLTLAGQCALAGSAYRSAHGALDDCYSLAGALKWAAQQDILKQTLAS